MWLLIYLSIFSGENKIYTFLKPLQYFLLIKLYSCDIT